MRVESGEIVQLAALALFYIYVYEMKIVCYKIMKPKFVENDGAVCILNKKRKFVLYKKIVYYSKKE